jgi:hypothetical protein
VLDGTFLEKTMTHFISSPITRIVRVFQGLALHWLPASAAIAMIFTFPAAHAADKNLTVSIYCLAYADGLKSIFVKSAADRYESVGLSTANIVEAPDSLVEDGRILLYGPADADGKYPVVANAEIGGLLQPLIVLQPGDKEGTPAYESKAVEADSKKFPLGSFHLVNLSPNPVRIIHEEIEIELESAGSRIFTPDHAAGESLAVQLDYKAGDNWVLLTSARWAARDDRRTLVCFQLDPVSKRMNIKSVPLREAPKR